MKNIPVLLMIIGMPFIADHVSAAGKTPKLDGNRLFYTAAQRVLINRLLANKSALSQHNATSTMEVVNSKSGQAAPAENQPIVVPEKYRPPILNGYLLAGERTVVWLDGKPVAGGDKYAGQVVRKSLVGGNVVFRIGAKPDPLAIPSITSLAGELQLEVQP